MGKVRFLVIIALLIALLAACGSEESNSGSANSGDESTDDTETSIAETPLTEQEFNQMFSDPDQFKGSAVEFTGQVFTVENDAEGVYLQVWADPTNVDQNTLISYEDPNFEVSEEDFVVISGTVRESFTGENAFGGEILAPIIDAKSVEVVDYITAISPTLESIEVQNEIDQSGFVVKVNKIEFAENETRVYASVTNNSDTQISVWIYSAKAIQGSSQFETETNYEANYPEIQSDILPGVTSEGIITFPALDYQTKNASIIIEGNSENYDITIDPFKFDITW